MDEESEIEQIQDPEEIIEEVEPQFTEAPPSEGAFGKYMREYRLLNSLLIALGTIVGIIGFMLAWTIVVNVGEESGSDFGDAGAPAQQQQQEKQKVVKLMQRQKKAQPSSQQTFKTTAVSDISLPDFNELDVKDLAPVIEATAPPMSQSATMNNQKMKSALKGVSLSLPKVMQQRCDPKKRMERLRSGGGKPSTEEAILKGLAWLKEVQDEDGGWGRQDMNSQEKPYRDRNNPLHRDGMTALSLLAFLGHCELQDSPNFGPTVQKAIDFIMSTAPDKLANRDESGSFLGLKGNGTHGMQYAAYSHAIRTYALCEAYTMTKIPKIKEYTIRAVNLIIEGQNPNGGWGYGYGRGVAASVDLSLSSWCVQALKAAALTGIQFDGLDGAMDNAIGYVKKCQEKGSGKFMYTPQGNEAARYGGPGRGSITGAGVLCLQVWKEAKSQEAKKGLEFIVQNRLVDSWKKVDAYEWYYHAQACFQSTGALSGVFWREWNQNFQEVVAAGQQENGRWQLGLHFHGESAIFRHALTVLMLEVYYRYAPMSKV
jgi:hypothetical protein